MTPESSTLNRRNVLKALGGVGAAGAVGAGGLAALTGSAAAEAVLDVNISGTSYSGDQGDLDWVGVAIDKDLRWDGFDVPLRYIEFTHEVTIPNQPGHTLYNAQSARLPDAWSSQGDGSDGWGGPGEYVIDYTGDKADGLKGRIHADVNWAVISDGSHPAEYDSVQDPVDWAAELSEAQDGATNDTLVTWTSTLDFYTEDGDGNAVAISADDGVPSADGSDDFRVSVTNEGGETTGSSEDGTSTTG